MDNTETKKNVDNEVPIEEPVATIINKRCTHCGQVLPISEFDKYAGGYRKVCKTCYREMSGASEKFSQFTSKELIEELRARGYKGKLTKTIVKEVVI